MGAIMKCWICGVEHQVSAPIEKQYFHVSDGALCNTCEDCYQSASQELKDNIDGVKGSKVFIKRDGIIEELQ